ncbi:MAG: hypothetical protein HGA87_01255 [Desulfobulbaceae bacterium]|nr:hypothetical protein [Desulfobulbaceae bacterium]
MIDLQPCLVASDGSVIELAKGDYTKRKDTGATVALDGSVGHVMMRIPKFYHRYSYINTDNHKYELDSSYFTGSTPHPGFWNGSAFVPYQYIGVYPACWYDASESAYVDGDGTNSAFDTSADSIGSIAGKKPLSYKTRSIFRAAAARVGTGFHLYDHNAWSILKWLSLAYGGTFNSQNTFGLGNTQFSAFVFATCISATGKVQSMTAAGQTTADGDSGDYVNMLGIEDLWGGLFEIIDGINIQADYQLYICQNPANYADATTTNYTKIGDLPSGAGAQNTLLQNYGMYPATTGDPATTTTKITDYCQLRTGNKFPIIGGSATTLRTLAGLHCMYDQSATEYGNTKGSRLCYTPPA